MLRFSRAALKQVSKRFWGTVFTLIIALAVLVQIGREAFPLLNDYRDDIAATIGRQLGINLHLGELSASWSGLRPSITLSQVEASSLDQQLIFTAENVVAELSLIDSLMRWQLAWHRLGFQDLATTLEQTEQGRWRVRGMPPMKASSKSFKIDDPLDIFLFGRRVEITNAQLHLLFRTGQDSQVSVPTIVLENDRDFHRVRASASVDGEPEFVTLVVEGTGDPRDDENFNSKGYLSVRNFPMEKALAAFAGNFWEGDEEQEWREGHRLNLQLWYEGTSYKGIDITGVLQADGLPLKVPDHIQLPTGLTTIISGGWSGLSGWDVNLQKMQLTWPEFRSPAIDVNYYGGFARASGFRLSDLDIESWVSLARNIGLHQSFAGNIVDTLSPKGTLTNINVSLTSKEEGYFKLRSHLEAGSVKAFHEAPAASGIDADIEASLWGGTGNVFVSDHAELDLAKIYDQPIVFNHLDAQVRWQIDPKLRRVYVTTGLIEATTEYGDAHANLALTLPFDRAAGEPVMTLAVGAESIPVTAHTSFVPKLIPAPLYSWLSTSIRAGTASDLSFIYHGSLLKKPEVTPSIQLFAKIENGDLSFDPNWPRLENLSGYIKLDNDNLDVHIDQASLLGNRVNDANIALLNHVAGGDPALRISGQLDSNAGAAMELLKQSPVREVFGSTFDSWGFAGDVSAAIELLVPLSESGEMRQAIDVSFTQARIDMRDIGLLVENVSGELNYDSDKGLTAESITAEVWGEPVKASIDSPRVSAPKGVKKLDTRIHFSGRVTVADVYRWTNRPELGFYSGQTGIAGVLTIPAANTRAYDALIEIKSNMVGVAAELPQPLAKSANQVRQLDLSLQLHNGFQQYSISFDDWVKFSLKSGETIPTSAQLAFGKDLKPLTEGHFDVFGNVPSGDLEEWNDAKARYFAFTEIAEARAETAATEEDIPIRLDIEIGRASLGSSHADNVSVTGLGTFEQWGLRVDSEMIAGNIIIHSDDRPIEMHLDYLHIPEVDAAATEDAEDAITKTDLNKKSSPETNLLSDSVLADIDLSELVAVNFSTQLLSIAGRELGNIKFDLRLLGDGIICKNISGNLDGILIGDATFSKKDKTDRAKAGRKESAVPAIPAERREPDSKVSNHTEQYAEFIWTQTEAGNYSHFTGRLRAFDGGEVIQAWGQPKVVEMDDTMVDADLSWAGAPDEISLQTIRGVVVFEMLDGSFIRDAAENENGLLRLLALFNFDTLARRLRLDFSDLAKEGFAFESVSGRFEFADGWVYIKQPLVVESTSSKIQMAGTLDLLREEVDAELVATLPLGGNLSFAAALVAGLPAALGVYLISKIFKSQVDKVSSVTYEIGGPWEDPTLKFHKVFSDSAAERKGKEAESLQRGRDSEAAESSPATEASQDEAGNDSEKLK